MRIQAAVGACLLVLTLGPATVNAQASTSQELVQADPEGDVNWGPQGFPAPAPSSPYTDVADLKGLRVYGETVEGIRLDLTVKNLKTPQPTTFGGTSLYAVSFRIDGAPIGYTMSWRIPRGPYQNETPSVSPQFCLRPNADSHSGCPLPQRVIAGADYASGRLFAYIPKASLLGRDGASDDEPPAVPLQKGARLTAFVATSNTQEQFNDRLPNQGTAGPLTLALPAANDRVRVRVAVNESAEELRTSLAFTDFQRVSVEPGVPTLVPLEVTNANGAKRIINFTAKVLEGTAARWEVRIAPGLQVPGNETRAVNLVVNATNAVEHRESALVQVVGVSRGFPDEIAAVTVRVTAIVPPSPTRSTLYFHHGAEQTQGGPFAFGGICKTVPGEAVPCPMPHWLNTLETDPLGVNDAKIQETSNPRFGPQEGYVRDSYLLDVKLARDLVLDIQKPVEGILHIKAGTSFQGGLDVFLLADDLTIGSQRTQAAGSGEFDVPVNFLPQTESRRIPAGSSLRFEYVLHFALTSSGGGTTFANPPGLLPKGSKLVLPVIPDPDAGRRGPSNLTDSLLTLMTKGDREEFVNPGKTKAFNVTLTNEGSHDETIELFGTVTPGTCGIRFVPGDAYRLEPGDAASFGVLIRAPENAKEGLQCVAVTNATSRRDSTLTAVLQLTATVTRGLEIPDDANWTGRPDASEKLATQGAQKRGAPGPGLVVYLAVAVLVVLGRRARRD